jgi:glucose-6-phosphate-specific signal transduction histidine kinase
MAVPLLQFRLRTLFVTTTAAAVLFWALCAPPQWLGLLAIYLAYVLLPAATVAGIVFHRGYWQAFFIGIAPCIVIVSFWFFVAQFQWSSPFWPFGPDMPDPFNDDPDRIVYSKLLFAIPLSVATVSGLVAVGIRWWALSVRADNTE